MRWGEAELLTKDIDNARFDADLLLAGVLDVPRDRLYLEGGRTLSAQEETEYRNRILRRAGHEPLQYILKRQEFMGLSFYVDERALIPRADSEILVEKWLEIVQSAQAGSIKVVDLCTGSGALAVAMAYYYPAAKVVGTDLSPDALAVARKNAERLNVSVEWRQGDFTEPVRGETWDYVVTNPPYVAEEEYARCAPEIFREPGMAFLGGRDGLAFYRRLAAEKRTLLKPQGKILMEIGWDQANAVCRIFQGEGFQTRVFPDLGGRSRVVVAR